MSAERLGQKPTHHLNHQPTAPSSVGKIVRSEARCLAASRRELHFSRFFPHSVVCLLHAHTNDDYGGGEIGETASKEGLENITSLSSFIGAVGNEELYFVKQKKGELAGSVSFNWRGSYLEHARLRNMVGEKFV